jgi:hypothetical protein
MSSIKRVLAVLPLLLLFPAAAQAQGVTANVSGGTLTITQDPGTSGMLKLLYYPPRPALADPVYSVEMMNFAGGPAAETRSSTCADTGTSVSCAAAGVSRIVIEAGDGDDEIGVGKLQFVNSAESAPIPVPVDVSLGDGKDLAYFRMADQAVTVDGGGGNDTVVTANPDLTDDVTRSLRFVGGPGDDEIGMRPETTETTFLGGEGDDAAGGRSGGATTLYGEAGSDNFSVTHVSGALTVIGGEGNDAFELDDIGSAASARTEVRAGAGNDTIEPRTTDGRDLLDCGAGSDTIKAEADFPRQKLLRHTYVDCPVVSARTSKAKLSARGAQAAIKLSSRARGRAKVSVTQFNSRGKAVFRSRAVRVRLVKGRSGRVTLKVPARLAKLKRARLRMTIEVTSVSRDRAKLENWVTFRR